MSEGCISLYPKPANCITERELVLMKIRAPPGPTRMEVLQLVEIFRARVADVSERSITLCVTGDAGKARPTLPLDAENGYYNAYSFSNACMPAAASGSIQSVCGSNAVFLVRWTSAFCLILCDLMSGRACCLKTCLLVATCLIPWCSLRSLHLRQCAATQTTAMERALSKFGVLEIARTGKISLKRGSALLQMGGWGDSATRRAHQARINFCDALHDKH